MERLCRLSAVSGGYAQVALMFLVRHEAPHSALWTAWLDSVNGLLPAATVHGACCRGDAAHRVSVRSLAVRYSVAAPDSTRLLGPALALQHHADSGHPNLRA